MFAIPRPLPNTVDTSGGPGRKPRPGKEKKKEGNDSPSRERKKKAIFLYDDGKFSKGSTLFDWPSICREMKWDAKKLCGPFCVGGGRRSEDCRDPSHRYAGNLEPVPVA